MVNLESKIELSVVSKALLKSIIRHLYISIVSVIVQSRLPFRPLLTIVQAELTFSVL